MTKDNIMLRTLGVARDELLVVLFRFSSVSTWWSEIKVVKRVVMLLVLMILVLIRTGQSDVFTISPVSTRWSTIKVVTRIVVEMILLLILMLVMILKILMLRPK